MKQILLTILLLAFSQAFTQGRIEEKVDSLKSKLNRELKDEERVTVLHELATILLRTDTTASTNYATQALDLSRKIDYREGEIDALEFFSRKYTEIGQLDTALQIINSILEWKEEIENKRRLANLYISKGNIHDIKGDYTAALDSYLKGEEFFIEDGFTRGVGMANLGIGNIYHTTERYEEAVKRFRKSANYLKKINDPYTSWPINNMATSMQNLGKLDSAEFYFKQSLEMKEANGDVYGASYTYSDLAELYVVMEQIDKAEWNLKKALELKLQVEGMSKETIGMTLIRLGAIQIKKGDPAKAIKNLREGLELAQKSASIEAIMDGYLHLSDALYKIGSNKEAYENLQTYSTLKDSIAKVKSSKALAEMQTKYETKEKEEQLLQAQQESELNKLKADKAEAESDRKNTLVYGAMVIVLLLLVGVGFAVRNIQMRKKNNSILRSKNKEITIQKDIVEQKNKEIMDSISYAKRIQKSFLATDEMLGAHLNEFFVYFNPKEAVSGDFYWAGELEDKSFALCCADSTGHGVPGAIMSLLNISSLEKAIEKGNKKPSDIFNATRKAIIERLQKDGSKDGGKDGMDASLIVLNQEKTKMYYVAAHNPIWIIRNGELIDIKGEKMPVGKHHNDSNDFTGGEIELVKGDAVYMMTDGYQDQFGGSRGKKFKVKPMKEFLLEIHLKSMKEQEALISVKFDNWKGDLEQVDDVCIIGIRV